MKGLKGGNKLARGNKNGGEMGGVGDLVRSSEKRKDGCRERRRKSGKAMSLLQLGVESSLSLCCLSFPALSSTCHRLAVSQFEAKFKPPKRKKEQGNKRGQGWKIEKKKQSVKDKMVKANVTVWESREGGKENEIEKQETGEA